MDKFQVIDKLEGERNWTSWKFDVDLQLTVNKVKSIITGEQKMPKPVDADAAEAVKKEYLKAVKDYEDADAIVKYILGSSVRHEPKQHILTCKTGKEMWDKLHSVYEQRNERRLDLLYTQLFNYQKDPVDDIAIHVSKLQQIWQDLQEELKAENVTLPLSMLLNRILNTLPSEYLEFKNAWESVPNTDRSIANLTERLRLHEQRLKEFDKNKSVSDSVALVVKSSANYSHNSIRKMQNASTSSNGETSEKKNARPRCFRCGKIGHIKKNCRVQKENFEKSGNKNKNTEKHTGQAFMITADIEEQGTWLVDSGASHHISSRLDWLSSYSAFSEPRPLRLGDGNFMYAQGEGEIQVEMLVNNKWEPGYLTKVWFVPGCSQNLFSVGSALDNGLYEYANSKCCEFRNKSGKTVAVAIRQSSGMYRLLLRVLSAKTACLAVGDNELQIWHERFGHQNKRHVKNFLKERGIEVGVNDNDEFCEACIYGKMHRLSFGTRVGRPTKPGELINIDVCGPMPEPSVSGKRYFVDFKDDFSKYRAVYFIKEKSEVKEKLEQFLAEVKVAGHTVKELLTDGGREFNNVDVQNITRKAGLQHRLSMPYTPQQNGAAERDNRTLVEAARTMLHARNLPEKLWAEAVNTATYIINRTGPTPIAGKSPYEIWYGKAACIDHLKVFGTECFIHVPKQKRKKFDKKAKMGYLVGYCGDKDGYRVWIPEENDVVLTRDIFKNEKTSRIVWKYPLAVTQDTKDKDMKNSEDIQEDKIIHEEHEEVKTENFENKAKLRSRSDIKKPSRFDDFVMLAIHDEPTNFEEAMLSKSSENWKEAMEDELNSLSENQTWELVDLPIGKRAIENRWVYRIKNNPDGTVGRFKARLVAKGYAQKAGEDFQETFSPVARFDTVRTLLSVAAAEKHFLYQFDICTAFLYGELEDDIFMNQPEGYDDGTGRVCKLKRSLYGLKQAPRCWNKRLVDFMKGQGFCMSVADPCLFLRNNNKGKLYVAVYVDDGLITGSSEDEIMGFINQLKLSFHLTSGPLNYFLGIQIKRLSDGSIFIYQDQYINKILKKFNMYDSNSVCTPCEQQNADDEEIVIKGNVPFREAVGSLMFLAITTRPDLAYAVSIVSQKLSAPTEADWRAVKRIFRYLKGSSNMGLLYQAGHNEMEAYSDADFAGDKATRRSTSGVVCKYAGGAVTWLSQKQKSVVLSTTESEYVAACEGTKEVIWLNKLLNELTIKDNPPVLYVDNLSAIKLAKNPEFHKRSKHIDIKFHFVREKYSEGLLAIEHIPSSCQIADLFTKPLGHVQFKNLCKSLGLVSLNDILTVNFEREC